jgi:hypothetical protein
VVLVQDNVAQHVYHNAGKVSVHPANYSTVQCNTVQYSTVQCSAIQYSTVQYITARFRTGVGLQGLCQPVKEPYHLPMLVLVACQQLLQHSLTHCNTVSHLLCPPSCRAWRVLTGGSWWHRLTGTPGGATQGAMGLTSTYLPLTSRTCRWVRRSWEELVGHQCIPFCASFVFSSNLGRSKVSGGFGLLHTALLRC